jgi:ornithine carbamoyltransferase
VLVPSSSGHAALVMPIMAPLAGFADVPRSLWPSSEKLELARSHAAESGGRVTVTEDVAEAVRGCDVLLTDVWVSMGEPKEVWAERIELLRPYQINADVMRLSGNPDVKFMHCLPAFHNTDTAVGKQILEDHGMDALEVTEEVFESPASIVFDEAENRLQRSRRSWSPRWGP